MNFAQFFVQNVPLYAVFAAILITSLVFCTIICFLCKSFGRKSKKTSLFLKTAAHDIRSPLTNIKGYADAIREGVFSKERVDSSLALISSESDRLARLCAGLSCGENAKLYPSVFGACDFLVSIMLLLDNTVNQKNVAVQYNFPEQEVYVRADRDALYEAVYNVLSNAVKYVDDGGKITISAKETDTTVEISISNTFSGEVPDKTKIFSAGYSLSAKSGGQGLGLYVADRIFARHGKKLVFSCDEVCAFDFSLDKAQESQTNVL